MRTIHYNRSEVYSFSEMSEEQQIEAVNNYGEDVCESSFVDLKHSDNKTTNLPLSMFRRTDSALRHAYMTISNIGAYCVTLSRCGSEAIVSIVC
jgi:hypothetical protein